MDTSPSRTSCQLALAGQAHGIGPAVTCALPALGIVRDTKSLAGWAGRFAGQVASLAFAQTGIGGSGAPA